MKRFIPTVMAVVLAAGTMAAIQGSAGAASGFTDLESGAFYLDAVEWAAEQELTTGISDTEFGPDQSLTRAQAVTFAWRAAGMPTGFPDSGFTDVPAGSFFEDAVNWAKATGVTTGISATEFGPDRVTSRAEFITFLWRNAGSPTGYPSSGLTDVPAGSFYELAVDWAFATGVTKGISPTEFGSSRDVTRAEAVTLMYREPVPLQILAINDFHGHIATSSSSFDGVGRADFLAANMRAAEASARHSISVSAGDLIGASPLISALFHDEPTIEAMNLIGLDINGVGNHEFDEGSLELLRMANGGTHPVDGDFGGDVFEGADFEFLAANVEVTATGETLFDAYDIRSYAGIDVAFIGMTLEGTPTIVTQAGVAGLSFLDEIETVNEIVPMLQSDYGIEAIVVLVHEGGFSDGGEEGDDCMGGLVGPLADIVDGFDPAVDLVIAGHVNDEFVCQHNDMWVTMADNRGRLFTDIDVHLDRETGDMTVDAIDNVPNDDSGTPAADLTALIDFYDALSAPLANEVIGTITADLTEDETPAGESALGDVIADAQLASTAGVGVGEAVAAFMNPGGIREDFFFTASGAEADGEVTYGEAFTTQPFGNSLVTMTLTGDQIDLLLEQQWIDQDPDGRILQVSDGFAYTWDSSMPVGSRVDPSTIMIDGVTVVGADPYRITVNSFLADGGDNFVVLRDGTDRLGGEIDLDALIEYFDVNSPLTPDPAPSRITVVP